MSSSASFPAGPTLIPTATTVKAVASSKSFMTCGATGRRFGEDPAYRPELFTREAVNFLSRQTAANPFLLYVSFGAPHYPMMAPQKYLDRFPTSMDRDRRFHAAMVASIDDGVGRILDQLEASGLAENTVVFFQSDNGATQETRADHRGRHYRGGSNAPFRGYKAGLFEGGIRMPTMLS